MRAAFPSRSPTTRSSWAAATRTRGIDIKDTAIVMYSLSWSTPQASSPPASGGEATRRLREVNELSVLTEHAVTSAIDASADAALARAGLTRVLEAHPAFADVLREDPRARDGLVAGTCAWRSLTSARVRDAELLDVVGEGDGLDVEHTVEDARAVLARHGADDSDPERALRRGKRAEYLRI